MRRSLALAAAALVLLGLCACGPEAAPAPTAQPMVAPDVRPAAAPADTWIDVPTIDSVRLDPDLPVAGRSVRAVVDLSGEAQDVRLEYAWRIGGRRVAGGDVHLDLQGARPGERLELTVTPYAGDQEGLPVHHAIRIGAPAPRVMGVSFVPHQGLTAGSTVEARPIVEDALPRQVSHRFQWIVNGRRRNAYEQRFDTTGLRRGDRVRVEVVAHAEGRSSAPFLSDAIELANAPPRLAGHPVEPSSDGGVAGRLEAIDPDGDRPLRFELVSGPDGLSVSSDGRLVWPADALAPGSHTVEVAIRDGLGASASSRFRLDVGVPAAPAE